VAVLLPLNLLIPLSLTAVLIAQSLSLSRVLVHPNLLPNLPAGQFQERCLGEMGWDQWLSMIKPNREERERIPPRPVACPHDGTPLEEGARLSISFISGQAASITITIRNVAERVVAVVMSSKIRWDEFMQRRFDHLTVVNAINALDHRWHRQHSDTDGSEFTVEVLYSPHLDLGSRGVPVSIEDLGSTCLTQIAGFVAMISLPFMPPTGTTGERIALEPP
jgi:hypothetical protein